MPTKENRLNRRAGRWVFALAIAATCVTGCGRVQSSHRLSDHFVVKEIGASFRWQAHLKLYVQEPNGSLTLIGAMPDPQRAETSPFGYRKATTKYFAVSEEGEAIVYAHNHGPPDEQAYGLYFRRYDEPERLLLPGYVGATDYGKPLPDYVVAIGTKGVTTGGEIVELALLESSALHAAALAGDVAQIDVLVQGGHDLHAVNYWEHEPLDLAIARRHEAAAVRLIEHGAHESPRSALLMYLAADYKLPEAVQALLLRGVSATAAGPEGLTPAHAAVVLPGAYVPHDVLIKPPTISEYGSILPLAVDVLRLLLAQGGDPNALSAHGETPLDLVAQGHYWWNQQDHPELREELRRLLIEAGARP